MDSYSTLYERLRERARLAQSRPTQASGPSMPETPPLEDWLRYWNDADTDLSNLRNLDHWLSRTRRERSGNNEAA